MRISPICRFLFPKVHFSKRFVGGEKNLIFNNVIGPLFILFLLALFDLGSFRAELIAVWRAYSIHL